ncbi:MAG: hypothetical protein HN585_01755 [Nitrosomonadales bacterium]|nr:hypothetical protein [Nitrosomonadales bacterium]
MKILTDIKCFNTIANLIEKVRSNKHRSIFEDVIPFLAIKGKSSKFIS